MALGDSKSVIDMPVFAAVGGAPAEPGQRLVLVILLQIEQTQMTRNERIVRFDTGRQFEGPSRQLRIVALLFDRSQLAEGVEVPRPEGQRLHVHVDRHLRVAALPGGIATRDSVIEALGELGGQARLLVASLRTRGVGRAACGVSGSCRIGTGLWLR